MQFGHKHYTLLLFTIHFHNNRVLEMNVPQVFRLVYGRLGIQEFLVVYTVVHKCIDGEIPYAERC